MHDWLRLRQAVFLLEQDCLYEDIDGKDPEAWHLLGWLPAVGEVDGESERLVAGARVFGPERHGAAAKVGRIVCVPELRGQGVGPELIRKAIVEAERLAPGAGIVIHAQAHLEAYYRRFGFEVISDRYMWDGIEHVDMARPASSDRPER